MASRNVGPDCAARDDLLSRRTENPLLPFVYQTRAAEPSGEWRDMIEPLDSGAEARARIDREAVDWLIALQEAPRDAALGERFAAWVEADPAHAAAWAETGNVSRLIAATRMSSVVRARRDRIEGGSRRRRLRRIPLFAAGAAAACLALVAMPGLIVRARVDAVAATGEMKTVRLADGSVVRLAAGSALAIDYGEGARKVRLLQGDGYFDVAHDPARPFQVEAGDTVTRVLGTAFEIRKGGDGVAVAVRRGRVAVACNDRSAASELEAGQTLDLACGVRSAEGRVEPSRIAPWVEGKVIVADRPMREIVDALRPWYGGIIIARGDGLDQRRVTGVYDLRHPEQALTALAAAHHASVRRITPWILVISAD
ncbi:MAG: FecR domain-containing protein [Sphingomonas sp.]|uniref:FecR family protein n=1 Tax=Sphingomonas sp. TaxID=28214 RepID=UPI0022738367|nr:FecR domain-containing protein [Sphingomonas sp.]MCX8476793.1 FecR domain-containing protein [Sphingomonas sp.]